MTKNVEELQEELARLRSELAMREAAENGYPLADAGVSIVPACRGDDGTVVHYAAPVPSVPGRYRPGTERKSRSSHPYIVRVTAGTAGGREVVLLSWMVSRHQAAALAAAGIPFRESALAGESEND